MLPESLYFTLIKMPSWLPMGIGTRAPLPKLVPLSLQTPGGEFTATFEASNVKIPLTTPQLACLATFTTYASSLVLEEELHCSVETMPFFLIPLKEASPLSASSINWEEISHLTKWQSLPGC